MNARVSFDWADPLLIDAQLSDEERLIRDAARGFAEAELMPMVRDAFRDEQVDAGLMRKLGSAGLLGPTIQGYGCAGGGMAHTGLPNFTQILGGASHLDNAASLVRRDSAPGGPA